MLKADENVQSKCCHKSYGALLIRSFYRISPCSNNKGRCLPLFLQTDLHLHCKEWDKLLRTGDWEPDIIAGKIPAFFKFVKSVQDFVLLEMRRTSEK